MSWDCVRLEQRLTDYLEAHLPPADLAAADRHARACPRCQEHWLARHATGWLRRLEPQESPPGLETRILAQTLSPAPRTSLAEMLRSAWHVFRQPRVALSAAASVLSLALVLNLAGVSLTQIELADLNPANLYRGVKRQANLTYAKGSRFVNDLWLVYEIRTRLEEMTPESQPPPENENQAPPRSPDAENNKNNDRQNRRPSPGRFRVLASSHTFLLLRGDLR